ncbi:probable lysine-specific demethylase 4B [Sipha flava]|uniref:Probable lysine-specific demethylase 4B n=1 Tax=Sipha flava TaxID=143950 RepID=A0A2S2QNF5_9HEMI|nr:probable lysine-specific demethylase 4B [Sipha flava]
MSGTPRIMVFRPTIEEFKNFPSYIEFMESSGAHYAGLAKVIPPIGWNPRKNSYNDYDIMNTIIPAPIKQVIKGGRGIYNLTSSKKRSISVSEFKTLIENSNSTASDAFDYNEIEKKYWKNINFGSAIYGADVMGSIMDSDVDSWNLRKLDTILDYLKKYYNLTVEGINTTYLYFGMWKATFAWHTEDMDLYSINYLHDGCPKTWYAIPPKAGHRFQRVVKNIYGESTCTSFLRHKMVVMSPSILKSHDILTNKITQESGEFMITFPFSYHMGFSHGFNIAESTNFAMDRWVEYGKRATLCSCGGSRVAFSMDTFVKRFQPKKYKLWCEGKDIGFHPEEPKRLYPAPVF